MSILVSLLKEKISATERSGIINMCLKPISAVLGLVYTPMLLAYLGDEKYGIWAAVLSIISWIHYFDVGIGNGLRNLLSKLVSEENEKEAKKAISTAYVTLTGMSAVLLIILIITSFRVNWNSVFSTDISMTITMLITFVFICINFVLALSNTLLYALQMAERVSIRNCLVQVANICGLWIISKFSSGNLVAMAILFGSTGMIMFVWNTIQVFQKNKHFIPSIHCFEKSMISEICNVGIKFFVIQIMCLMLFTVDNLLITHFFGGASVTPFSIANKAFNMVYSVFAAFIVPYWSRTTVAVAQKNIVWIKSSIKKVSMVCLLFILAYAGLFVLFKPLARIWLQRELNYQPGLIFVMFIFYCIYSVLGVECQFINGSGKINAQLIMYIIIGLLNIPLSIFVGVTCGLGPMGIRLATTLLVIIAVVILGLNLRFIVKGYENEFSEN